MEMGNLLEQMDIPHVGMLNICCQEAQALPGVLECFCVGEFFTPESSCPLYWYLQLG